MMSGEIRPRAGEETADHAADAAAKAADCRAVTPSSSPSRIAILVMPAGSFTGGTSKKSRSRQVDSQAP
jgi:hypothetical protein